MALKIRKDDQIMVVAGKEKGKTGKVLRVDPEKEKVYVEKLNMIKRHQKPSAKYKHGGIIEKEAPIHVSNVMILCGKCKGPVRTGKALDGDRRVRVCKKCGEVLDK
ncbi:MAG: 50S ribosomal protein L24 [Deltaproteobacteria bacterium]|nr:50S ribosomal protein L24 [Deltaproteobacteria bacterium]